MKDSSGQYRVSSTLVRRVRECEALRTRARARYGKTAVSEREVLEEGLRLALEVADGVR